MAVILETVRRWCLDRRKTDTPVAVDRRKKNWTSKESQDLLDNAIDNFSQAVIMVTSRGKRDD